LHTRQTAFVTDSPHCEPFEFVELQITPGHPISNETKEIPHASGKRFTAHPARDPR